MHSPCWGVSGETPKVVYVMVLLVLSQSINFITTGFNTDAKNALATAVHGY